MDKKTNIKSIKKALIYGVFLCLPITGFIYGFIICSDCENSLFGFLGRFFIGFVFSFFTTLSLGNPVTSGIGTQTNIRIYVFLAFVIITCISYLITNRKNKQE